MSQTKMLLGRRIREVRKGCRLSQEQLAELVGVDFRYISKIELGKCYPSLETLDKIAQALHIELRELFEFGHLEAERSTRQAVDTLLHGLGENECQLVLKIDVTPWN